MLHGLKALQPQLYEPYLTARPIMKIAIIEPRAGVSWYSMLRHGSKGDVSLVTVRCSTQFDGTSAP
jgi:hypothetical protein